MFLRIIGRNMICVELIVEVHSRPSYVHFRTHYSNFLIECRKTKTKLIFSSQPPSRAKRYTNKNQWELGFKQGETDVTTSLIG